MKCVQAAGQKWRMPPPVEPLHAARVAQVTTKKSLYAKSPKDPISITRTNLSILKRTHTPKRETGILVSGASCRLGVKIGFLGIVNSNMRENSCPGPGRRCETMLAGIVAMRVWSSSRAG